MASSFFLTTVAAAIGILTLLRKLRFHQDNQEKKSSSLSPSSSPPSSSTPSLSPSSVHPTSLSCIWTHQVFPSFRGEDVRRGFLSHIQMEFQRMAITPFIDNEIKRGESIGLELIRAIRGSKIAIILLSRNYASSKWCLDELVEIMKCREELGQTVMAIFYKVDPSDVKKLTGDFGKVFRKTCAGKTKEDIGRWRQDLAKVATIAGYHLSNWDNEAAMIKKIATDISNILINSTPSSDFDGLVGMRAHLERMEPLLCLESDEVRMTGIWGPPGIGKTTIARVLYNQLSNSFQLSVFMENIKANHTRPCSDEYSAKLQLQQQFMSQITNQKDMEIPHLGVAPNRLKDKKVLVVLDGVDKSLQLDAMAKETWWFGPGSRIIITTQDHKLFRAHGINHIYKVNFPPANEALQILCMYAFGQNSPKDGFEGLAWEVTRLVGNLPLGLRVMGSYFRGMSKEEWRESLPRLYTSLDADIQSILKFSYDALDDEDKDIFLHIAYFFNREEITIVEAHLAKKFVDARQRLNILAEKSLISFSNWGGIEMHSLLRKLGREIVRKQSIHEPGQCQFLDNTGRAICDLLNGDPVGSKSVIGINLHYLIEEEFDISERALEGMSNLQFLRFHGDRYKFQLPRGLKYLSRKLQLLDWNGFPMTCLPSNLNVEFLIELNLEQSKLEMLWEGSKALQNLKTMDLSYSVNLKELPDLSTAINLQKLILSGCSSLIRLPSCIGNAPNLEDLYLDGCSSLVELPSFGNAIINLRTLLLCGCSNLLELPSSIGNAINLRKLDLSGCSSLIKLPSSIGNVINILILDLIGCSNLLELPSSIGSAIDLQKLRLKYCSSLIKLPSSIGNAINLQELDLCNCSNLVELPLSIGNLQKLQYLGLKGCSKLEDLPSNINLKSLDILVLSDCSMLKRFPEISTNVRVLAISGTAIEEVPPSIRSWPRLDELRMSYFENLKEFPHALDSITDLVLSDTETQEVPPLIKRMSRLKMLMLKGCRNVVSLPQIPGSLERISAEDCESLEKLDCSFHNPKITLIFGNCFKLNEEARDLIIETPTSGYAILPGGEVPRYFTHRTTNGGSLTIKLNQRPLPAYVRFKVCILLVYNGDNEARDKDRFLSISFGVASTTGGKAISPVLTEHLYTFEIQAKVTSSELDFKFTASRSGWKVGECGVRQLLEVP